MGASESSTANFKARLDELTKTAQQSASEIAGLQSALDAAAKAGKTGEQPGTAEAVQIAALTGSINTLKERMKTVEDGLASARSEVSSLSARLDDIAKQRRAPEAGSKAAQIAAAYAAVEKRISEGKPFAAEIDKLKGLDPNLPGLAELASVAGKGVLGESDLASGLDRALSAVTRVTQAATPSGEEGWLAALKRRVFSVVRIRKVGEPDWQAAGAMRQGGPGARRPRRCRCRFGAGDQRDASAHRPMAHLRQRPPAGSRPPGRPVSGSIPKRQAQRIVRARTTSCCGCCCVLWC